MDEEQILSQKIFNSLVEYGLKDGRAAGIVKQTVEKARRSKHSGPISHPGILIDDRVASTGDIIITIRKEKLEEYDPHEVLQEYIERVKYPGEWHLGESLGNLNSKVRVWKATSVSTQVAQRTKKVQKDIIKDFSKLSPEEKKKVLENLQK